MKTVEVPKLPGVFVAKFQDYACCLSSPVHRHPFYELVWVSEGQAHFFCDFQDYVIPAGTMAFIAPGQVHQWQGHFEHVNLTIVGFTLNQLAYYGKITQVVSELPFQDDTHVPFLSFTDEVATIFEALFETIRERFVSRSANHKDVLSAYLNVILVELQRVYVSEATLPAIDSTTQLAQAYRKLVEQHFLEYKQVQDYAQMLGITLNHLVESIRKTTGQTPKQILQERLVLEAKRLLIHTGASVAEISHQLDFKTPSYFGSWFKKLEGITPVQFRQTAVFP